MLGERSGRSRRDLNVAGIPLDVARHSTGRGPASRRAWLGATTRCERSDGTMVLSAQWVIRGADAAKQLTR